MDERDIIIRYLIDNTPMILDMKTQDLKYDARNINYRIYKYIKDLEDKLKRK